MPLETSNFIVLASLALLATLGLLVLGKRVTRNVAERRSRARRARWLAALGSGPVTDVRMSELRSLARQAARSAAAQEDMLALVAAGELLPPDPRVEPLQSSLRRGGLTRALRNACRSRSPSARGRAALLWAQLALPGAEHAAGRLMVDPDPDVRAAATQALAACASEEAAWALLEAMRAGHVEPQRVVERLTGQWAVQPLLTVLRDPGFADVRPWLAEALGLTRDGRAERPLADLLAGGDEEQRIRACRALGRLGRRTSSSLLITALADRSPGVRAQAARGLAELREVRAVDALSWVMGDRSWWVRARAADALRSLGPAGLAALRECARAHPDPFARERAAEALAKEAGATLEAVVA